MYLFLYCVLCLSSNSVRYMYDAVRRDFALSTSFVLECFDGSEVVLIRLVIFLDAIVHLANYR